MSYPAAVDLRSQYDTVYSQGSDCSCGPHALTAALDCMYERATGKEHRFDKAHLWQWAKFHNGILSSTNTGTDISSLCKALNTNGVVLGDKVVTGFNMVPTRLRMAGVEHFKHLLCLGIPLVYVIRMPLNLYSLTGDWRTHTLDLDRSGTQERFHFVCVVGYDDSYQRFLFENSWGDAWGDGGFFGVPFDQIGDPALFCGLAHVDMAPVLNVPVDGYTVPAYLTQQDKLDFSDRAAGAIKASISDAFGTGGPDAVIQFCKRWGVSDKHVEVLFGWERGSLRRFKTENECLDWDGFVWEQY